MVTTYQKIFATGLLQIEKLVIKKHEGRKMQNGVSRVSALLLVVSILISGCNGGSSRPSSLGIDVGGTTLQLTYRDHVEISFGGCKSVLFTLDTAGTELENKQVNYTIGIMEEGQLESLSKQMEVVDMWTYDEPPHERSPITVITIRTSPHINAIEHKLWVQLEAEGVGIIDHVPLTINFEPSADDLGPGPGSFRYLADIHSTEYGEWPPVLQKKLFLSDGQVEFCYRDHIEMKIGEAKWNILKLAFDHETECDPLQAHYTFGVMSDGEFGPLPEMFDIERDDTYQGPYPWFYSRAVLLRTSPSISPGEYELGIQIEVEGFGITDWVPLTVEVVESADDVIETPDGPAYRASVQPQKWPRIEEVTTPIHGE